MEYWLDFKMVIGCDIEDVDLVMADHKRKNVLSSAGQFIWGVAWELKTQGVENKWKFKGVTDGSHIYAHSGGGVWTDWKKEKNGAVMMVAIHDIDVYGSLFKEIGDGDTFADELFW